MGLSLGVLVGLRPSQQHHPADQPAGDQIDQSTLPADHAGPYPDTKHQVSDAAEFWAPTGVGSTPAWRSQTVEGAILWPSPTSSPWILRSPQPGVSEAIRNTSCRMPYPSREHAHRPPPGER